MLFSSEIQNRSRSILENVESQVQIPTEFRDTALSASHAEALINTVLQCTPSHTLEIGLGWGFSAACIQAAGSVSHTIVSIDEPNRQQRGIANARLFGNPQLHFQPSDMVLPRLLPEHRDYFDLILIDGGHLFDQVIIDVHYSLQLCSIGGFILIDDTWLAPVSTACAWIERNLSHVALVARIDGLAIYRKRGTDDRHWTHWEPFIVTPARTPPE